MVRAGRDTEVNCGGYWRPEPFRTLLKTTDEISIASVAETGQKACEL